MRLLNCVLTISAGFVAGIAGSTTTGGDPSNVATRATSSTSAHTNGTLFVASSPGRLHGHVISKIKQEDQLDEERTLSSPSEALATLFGRSTTEKLMESVGQRVEEEGLINNGKVANLEEFAVLLGGVYRPLDTTHWNYGKVVEVLTKSKINKGLVPFQPEELAEAFHSLRKAPDMMEHADRLQGILAYKNPDLLENEKLFRLWTAGGDALAPEDVFKILTSGFRYKAPDVTLPFERKRMVRIDNHVVKPLQRYIESYRKAKHDYSKDKETELLSVFTKYPGFTFGLRADEKTPKHGTNE